jgi:hypothetical protein
LWSGLKILSSVPQTVIVPLFTGPVKKEGFQFKEPELLWRFAAFGAVHQGASLVVGEP